MRIWTAVIYAADIPKQIIYQYEYKVLCYFQQGCKIQQGCKRFKVNFLCIGLTLRMGYMWHISKDA